MSKYISQFSRFGIRAERSEAIGSGIRGAGRLARGQLSDAELLRRIIDDFNNTSFLDQLNLLPKGKSIIPTAGRAIGRAAEQAAKYGIEESQWGRIALVAWDMMSRYGQRDHAGLRWRVATVPAPAGWEAQPTCVLPTNWGPPTGPSLWLRGTACANYPEYEALVERPFPDNYPAQVHVVRLRDNASGHPVGTAVGSVLERWKRVSGTEPWTPPSQAVQPVAASALGAAPAPQPVVDLDGSGGVPAGTQVSTGGSIEQVALYVPESMPAIVVDTKSGVQFQPPTHQSAKPPKNTRERKMRLHLHPAHIAMKMVGAATNGVELIDCLYKSLPKSTRKNFRRNRVKHNWRDKHQLNFGTKTRGWKPAPQDKLWAAYRYAHELDLVKFSYCVVANKVEDRVYAEAAKGLRGLYNAGNFHHGIQTGPGGPGKGVQDLPMGYERPSADISGNVQQFLEWLGSFAGHIGG